MPAPGSVVAILSLAPLLCAQSPQAGTLSGHITNTVTGAGIEGVTVYLCIPTVPSPNCGPEVEHALKRAVTDDKGDYRMTDIPDGQYSSFPPSKEGFFPNLNLSPVRVFGDAKMDFEMPPFAALRGRVTDSEGKPAAGITVKFGPLVDEQETDEKGEFVLEDIPPGSFVLSATPPVQPVPKEGRSMVTTYYPSVVDSSQAVPLKVQGVDLFGYEIRMQAASAHSIHGVVIGLDGKPAPKAEIRITRPVTGRALWVRGPWNVFTPGQTSVAAAQPVQTKDDGTFEFPPVLDGDWTVRAVLRLEDFSIRSGTAEVRVSEGDIQNLEIRLVQPFEVEVTADWGDPSPATPPPVRAEISFVDAMPPVSPPSQPGPGQPQLFQFYAGRFLIGRGFSTTPGYYLVKAMLDNRDVLGQVVEISGPTSLKLFYKSGGGSVRGTVEKGANARVVLMAEDTPTGLFGFSAWCDDNGAFSIADVPPGRYTALAVPELNFVVAPEFPNVLASSGKRIEVEAGATAQVEIKLTRQP